MSPFLDEAAGRDLPQEQTSDFPQLPENAWLLLETEDGEAAQYNDEIHNLRCGTKIIGGDENVPVDLWNGRFGPRVDVFCHKYQTKEMDGKFIGMLNVLFSPGLEGDERRANTMKALNAAGEQHGLEAGDYETTAAAMAHAAALALHEGSRRLLAKVRKDKKGYNRISSFEDATPENLKNRGVEVFPEDGMPF